jgi:hypothetical protein
MKRAGWTIRSNCTWSTKGWFEYFNVRHFPVAASSCKGHRKAMTPPE